MSDVKEWEFMLNGDLQEFREYARQEGTAYFNIYGGVDHWLDCPNDDFRMTTLYCRNEVDQNVVWQVGYELISLFNGASVLFSKNYRKASIFKLLNNECFVDYVEKSGGSGLLGKPIENVHDIAKEYNKGINCSIKFGLLHLATENEDVYFILKYLDMGSDWSIYYKLMEAIETFAERNQIDLETNKNQRKYFTNTANNFSLSGFDSRHGFKEVTKTNNTASMNLDQAYEFVTTMAKKYLQKRYFSSGKNA